MDILYISKPVTAQGITLYQKKKTYFSLNPLRQSAKNKTFSTVSFTYIY
jgi:hypothetical protein